MDLASLASVAAILTALFAFFNYVVIKPLRYAIQRLEQAIDALRRESQERLVLLHSQEIRLSVLEEHAKRIDEQLDELKQIENHK